jgi:hypothetical protein
MDITLRFRIWALPLLLSVGCMNEPGDNGATVTGDKPSAGSFQVSLVVPTAITQGYTSVLGRLYNGPTPSSLVWKEAAKDGGCRLLTPKAPFCEIPCGSGAACVDDGKCQDFPTAITAGKVTVKGMKTKSGKTTFTMDPVLKSYQPGADVLIDYPPFAEGEQITFSAAGDTSGPAFTVSAIGIAPLRILNDTITLMAGKPISLEWTPAATPANSSVSVLVDISHHGGTKGKIECEGADTGKLEIAATLVDQLKALGVSGFPKIEVSRKTTGTNADVHIDVNIGSTVIKDLTIPGLISCTGDEVGECPDGQTCQKDLQCK